MIEAAIDIGTNTMLLLVAEVDGATAAGTRVPRVLHRVLAEEIQYPRLGQGVHANRNFSPDAMTRAREVFQKYKKICDELGVKKISAMATSASRDSLNAKEFYDSIRGDIGIDVQIISGESEAKLTFLGGLLPMNNPKESAVLDIGGGSTEFVLLDSKTGGLNSQSVNIGCVRATELFLKGDPYERASLETLETNLRQFWKTIKPDLSEELKKREWVGVAGTPTTLAAIQLGLSSFVSEKVDGYRLTRCAIGDWYESLALKTTAQRASNPLMSTGRADIMVAGTAILLTAMETFEREDIMVSCRGLRHGVLMYPGLVG
ncbi:MAG TPA: hypothetical protein PLH57_06555 [Oligoflexia bacterium]|nr:hypothetical protein [Oligoflexia bacterium]